MRRKFGEIGLLVRCSPSRSSSSYKTSELSEDVGHAMIFILMPRGASMRGSKARQEARSITREAEH